jgi:ribose transport system permease protein
MSNAIAPRITPPRFNLEVAARFGLLGALLIVLIGFSIASPTFLTGANIFNVLVNNVALLGIVSLGMTLVVGAGGIDLSVGTSIDLASLGFISLLSAGIGFVPSALGGLLAAAAVGVFNALLISVLRITPFLATLGTLFIGQSLQQLLTNGGQPIYLVETKTAPFAFLGHGVVGGIPVPLLIAALCLVIVYVVINQTTFGRHLLALGAQPAVAVYSGLRNGRGRSIVYIMAAVLAGVAGLILSSTVRSYVPNSGNAFLLDAIGATFIGTTLNRQGRANAIGTVLGVLLLGFVKNGLLLIGMNFYWQQVGTGLLIFAVLSLSFFFRKLRNSH